MGMGHPMNAHQADIEAIRHEIRHLGGIVHRLAVTAATRAEPRPAVPAFAARACHHTMFVSLGDADDLAPHVFGHSQ